MIERNKESEDLKIYLHWLSTQPDHPPHPDKPILEALEEALEAHHLFSLNLRIHRPEGVPPPGSILLFHPDDYEALDGETLLSIRKYNLEIKISDDISPGAVIVIPYQTITLFEVAQPEISPSCNPYQNSLWRWRWNF